MGRQWICIIADEALCAFRGEDSPSRGLIQQRRKGYYDLNIALRARDTRFEEILGAMIVMGPHEWFFGTARSRNLHSTTVNMLLRSRGSLKLALAAVPNIEPYYIAAQFGLGKCYFSSQSQLHLVKDSWWSDILGILHVSNPLHSTSSVPWRYKERPENWHQLTSRMVHLSLATGSAAKSRPLWTEALQFALLLEFAWTILRFADSTEFMVSFFHRLDYLTSGMLIGGASGIAKYDYRIAAVGPAFSRARRDITPTWATVDLLDCDAEVVEMLVNSLKIFQYLEQAGRDLVMARLSSWISAEPTSEEQSYLSEVEVAVLDKQIERSWAKARGNSRLWS